MEQHFTTCSSRSNQSDMTVVFTFDQAKCTGCQACILACTIENQLPYDRSWRSVHTFNERHYPNLPVHHLSIACNHCDDPACLRACPSGAYSKNGDTGFVDFDAGKCIGCRYCTWACPFGAPRFDRAEGVVGKCTFCSDRQMAGQSPACVELCPTGALGLSAGEGHNSRQTVAGFPRTSLGPAIAIAPASDRRAGPDSSAPTTCDPFVQDRAQVDMVSAIREEWPLATFTFLVPILVGLLSTSVFTGQPPSTVAFLGISALAAILSSAHLGKQTRAWRAILHLRSSWLSREVSLFGVLAVVGAGYLALGPGNGPIGWLALAAGFATLMSIDRVYAILPLLDGRRYHSASALLTGLFLVGVFSANPLVAGSVGAGKLLLYVQRKFEFQRKGKPARVRLSALRIAVGLLVPIIALALNGGEANLFVVVAVLFGELIDRLEFYAELDVVTPEKQMTVDLHEAIS